MIVPEGVITWGTEEDTDLVQAPPAPGAMEEAGLSAVSVLSSAYHSKVISCGKIRVQQRGREAV